MRDQVRAPFALNTHVKNSGNDREKGSRNGTPKRSTLKTFASVGYVPFQRPFELRGLYSRAGSLLPQPGGAWGAPRAAGVAVWCTCQHVSCVPTCDVQVTSDANSHVFTVGSFIPSGFTEPKDIQY